MSSLPNSSYLSVTPNPSGERVHRHRRSAAISGDFDAYGLGLFSPSSKVSNKDDDIDKHFNFNNEEDFAKSVSEFSFPNAKNFDSMMISSPPRYYNSNQRKNLNSPIKLNQKRSFSKNHGNSTTTNNPNTPQTKFFMSVENNFNNDNVPDAVIDLDEVLNANLHIGDYSKPQRDREDMFFDEDFLGFPGRPSSSPFSPSMHGNTLLQQPIQESTNDDLESDDDNLLKHKVNANSNDEDFDDDLFNPPHISGDIYSNSSANSSTSSLKKQMADRNLSHSSNASPASGHPYHNSTPKRSGAKANRYQSFYDQSFKISNALKFSSSESVNLTKPSSPKHSSSSLSQAGTPNSTNFTPLSQSQSQGLQLSSAVSSQPVQVKFLKENQRLLAHSSSLPTLQPQRTLNKYRYGDLRKYNDMSKLSPPPSFQCNNLSTQNNSPVKNSLPKFVQKETRIEISVTSPKQHINSNSPVSIISDTNSTTMSNISTVQSTDHSSFSSESKDKEREKRSLESPQLETRNTKEHSDIETVHNYPTLLQSMSGVSSPKRSPRRPLTPNEEKILKETMIPPFKDKPSKKKSLMSRPDLKPPTSKYGGHHKSKSFSMILSEMSPKLSRSSTSDDTSSIKSNNFFEQLQDKYEKALDSGLMKFNGSSVENEAVKLLLGEQNKIDVDLQYSTVHSLMFRPEKGDFKKNPFEDPEPELTVIEDFGDENQFRIVFNKFPVVPRHIMLLTKKFKPQKSPLSPDELVGTYTILKELAKDKNDNWFGFYNCGDESGASQPHKHVQFMILPKDFKPFPEIAVEKSEAFIPSTNQEPLQLAEIPFAHYIAKLPSLQDLTEEQLTMYFSSLLQRTLTVLREHEAQHISYNVIMTTKYMMMVPRSHGKYQDLGINSCGILGLFLFKNEELLNVVKNDTPQAVWKYVGFSNTHGEATDEYHY